MDKVKVVLSGIGGYGMTYVNALLDGGPDKAALAGVCDPFPEGCPRLGELKALCPVYASLGEFFAAHKSEAELAVISAPIQYHAGQILLALENGCDVLCEKPLTGDEKAIESLIAARDRSGRNVSVGYQWSHSAAILELKRDILDGRFGAPRLLKTIVLWPRAQSYYRRGTGWAGRLNAADGTPIRDSVAHNATAHYLHNILYILGGDIALSRMPGCIEYTTAKINNIETFDTAVIGMDFGDCRGLFIASHAAARTRNPEFIYEFGKGKAVFPVEHEGKKVIAGYFADGSVKYYGDPFARTAGKLWHACRVLRGEEKVVCGIEAAAPEVKVIARLSQSGAPFFAPEVSKVRYDQKGDEFRYVEGLDELLGEIYDSGNFTSLEKLL